MRALAGALALAVMAAGGCGGEVEVRQPLSARGAELAQSPGVTGSRYNVFACTTCHAVRAGDVGTRIFPGAPLEGAARRPSFWGGETTHLREAVERCWVFFMRGVPEDLDGPNGQAIWAWLESIAPTGSTVGTSPVANTWPRTVGDPGAGGDPTRGMAVWNRACASCHGGFSTGAGRLGPLVSIVPQATVDEHCDDELPPGYPDYQSYIRGVLMEKTRHGSFLGYAGTMPPFSEQALTDDEVRDLASMFRCP